MSEPELKLKALTDEISSLHMQIEQLEQRCSESEDALDAIRTGSVDALVVYTDEGEKIYTIQGAETTYRLMIESINEGAATLIEDGTILYCNHRFAEMLAAPLEEVIGTSINQYIPQEDKAIFSSLLQRGIREDCPVDDCREEIDLLCKDGSHIPVMVSVNNFSAIGSPGVSLVASDLKERMKIEELTLQNAVRAEALSIFSRSLVEASLDESTILEVTVQTAIRLVGETCIIRKLTADNQALVTIASYHPDPEINHSLEHDSPDEPGARNDNPGWQVIKTGVAVLLSSIETVPSDSRLKSGTQAYFNNIPISSLLVVPLCTSTNNIGTLSLARLPDSPPYTRDDLVLAQRIGDQAALAISNARLYKDLQDVLLKEQTMRLQLIQVEKLSALNRMMATVVHEINNPVQTIKNCLYLIKLDFPPDSTLNSTLDIASSELDRIAKLVSTLRDVYRQPKIIAREHLNLVKILSDVHTILDPHLQHQKVTWQLEFSTDPLWINGIADHLKQVFLNLCMNAVEAMQPGGGNLSIFASTSADLKETSVTITDTGTGIEPENMQKLFEPFFTTKQVGSGLGLSICYEIVQQHAGRISVESQPGVGSTFTVFLPTAEQPIAV